MRSSKLLAAISVLASILLIAVAVDALIAQGGTNGDDSVAARSARRPLIQPSGLDGGSGSPQRYALGGNANCGSGAGVCSEANGTPGCDDIECCNAVCALDPSCCDVAWDSDCAGPNSVVQGASCTDVCTGSGQSCEADPPAIVDIATSVIGGQSGTHYEEFGVASGLAAFAAATTACNVGSEKAEWQHNGRGMNTTNRHPLIIQNLYRLSGDGQRFEMIGMSWLKHAFCAVSETTCGDCIMDTGCDALGIGCADTYSASRNGSSSLGPRRDVNPLGFSVGIEGEGTHTHPYAFPSGEATLRGRLQVNTTDLAEAGSQYFFEVQYVTHDEQLQQRYNNASWVKVDMPSDFPYTDDIANDGPVMMGEVALYGWQASDPGVEIVAADDPDGGRFLVACRVSELIAPIQATGKWHYEYAVNNMNSHRAARTFRVPIPLSVVPTGIGFRDVDYHSGDGDAAGGEDFDGTDWVATVAGGFVSWEMSTAGNVDNANALRWGTTYSFRFDADMPPTQVTGEIVHYRDSSGAAPAGDVLTFSILAPSSPACTADCSLQGDPCNPASCDPNGPDGNCDIITPVVCDDGDSCTDDSCSAGVCINSDVVPCCGNSVCELGEHCNKCADDCLISGGESCGNGVCEPSLGEGCLSCSQDCKGKQSGKPERRFCCGGVEGENPVGCDDDRCNGRSSACSDTPVPPACCGDGTCEGAEDVSNCVADCDLSCADASECDDGDPCTTDACIDGACSSVFAACGPVADGCCGADCNSGNDADCVNCGPKGSDCTEDIDCCDGRCRQGTCRGDL